jgi:excisionase family DNA binding protein
MKAQQDQAVPEEFGGPHGPMTGPGSEPRETRIHSTLWDAADAAAYLRISINSLYKLTARKAAYRIPHVRLGKGLRFRRTDIDRWLDRRIVSAADRTERVRRKVLRLLDGHNSPEKTR